jgi:Amt family ammonium transporter
VTSSARRWSTPSAACSPGAAPRPSAPTSAGGSPGTPLAQRPHDLNIAAVGWYGCNPGSTLSAVDHEGIGRVAANARLAATGGLVAMTFVDPRSEKRDIGMTIHGFLGGLVAVPAPCSWESSLGAVTGAIVPLAVDVIEVLLLDDSIDAVAIHGSCGVVGARAVGRLATGDFGIPGQRGADSSGGTVDGRS